MITDYNYDTVIRDLYEARYFQNRIKGIVNNPQPVDNASEVLAAAKQMTGDDIFALAQRYGLGKGVPRNYAFSAELLQVAADKGHAQSLFELAQFKLHSFLQDDYYVSEIINDYQKAYEMGWKPAAEMVAHLDLHCGDLKEAIEYYRMSSEDGNVDNVIPFFLIKILANAILGEDDDDFNRQAMETLRTLPQDNVAVLNFLGDIYHDGMMGVTVDVDKAWEYYTRAANAQDYSDELTNIVNMAYPFTSIGLGKSYDFPLLQKPLTGSGEAMYQLGLMILNGEHGNPDTDHDKAIELIDAAASRHYLNAILLSHAIYEGASEEEINRLINGDYNKKETEWFVDESGASGDFFSMGLNQWFLNFMELME